MGTNLGKMSMQWMKILMLITFFGLISIQLSAQEDNCFLLDFEPKSPLYPPSESAAKPTAAASVNVNIDRSDVQYKISKYIFGNAIAVWVGNEIYNPTLMGHLEYLAPTLIRYPGGSWSNIFFWDGHAEEIPDHIYTGNGDENFPQFGMNSWPTTIDNYYDMRWDLDTQGLITINYAYARYGTADDPVAQAAHYAADWVRYDDGRTLFWEIGNENYGSWETGWRIDTSLNKDGQPEIINGETYGKHFKVFADSMRAAAREIDVDIYIGAILKEADAGTEVERNWNECLTQIGDAADFYVVHNYFGSNTNAQHLLDRASTGLTTMMDYLQQEIRDKGAGPRPITVTEYNMTGWSGFEQAKTSIINGMQAVILFNELIKNNYGMAARWLIANWESDGMFYTGNDSSIPDWSPRPAFYYTYYLEQVVGDHLISSESDNSDVLAYTSTFESGEIGLVLVNKGTSDEVVNVNMDNSFLGESYYVYSLTGGDDDPNYSQEVYVNDNGPTDSYQGPLDDLDNIPAYEYPVDGGIKIESPGRSVQFVLIESDPYVGVRDEQSTQKTNFGSKGFAVYPNPSRGSFTVSSEPNRFATVEVFDILGRRVFKRGINPTQTSLNVNTNLSTGMYFVRMNNKRETKTMKIIINNQR